MVRPKPIIPITLFGPTGQDRTVVLVDSGADDVVFPMRSATVLGIPFGGLPQGQAMGVGGKPLPLVYAPVILELDDGNEVCRWRATVAFSTAMRRYGLLGIAGGLQYNRTTIDVEALQVELIATASLPRTSDSTP